MKNKIEKAPRRISAWKELRIFTTEYMQILMGRKKDLLISLMFPVLAAIIVVWIAGENMFVHYDGTKSGSFVRLQAAGIDAIIKIEVEAGHGGTSGRYKQWREVSYENAWCLSVMGLTR